MSEAPQASPSGSSSRLEVVSSASARAAASLMARITLPRALYAAAFAALFGAVYWWRFSSNAVNASSNALADLTRARTAGTKSNMKTDALAELGYRFGLDGVLVEIASGKKFVPKNAAHFELIAERAQELVQKDLYRDFEEVWVPVGSLPLNGNNIFVTPDWQSNESLLVIIQNSGVERPGVFSRQLLLTESRAAGSMETAIEEAIHKRTWAVIVLNPNLTHSPLKAAIQGSETPEKHTLYVYDAFLSKAKAKRVFVLGVGNGGRCAVHLARNRPDFAAAVTAMALVNSLHSVDADALHVNGALKEVLAERTQNWVTSDQPLGSAITTPYTASNGCVNVSSGVERNLFCLNASLPSVFAYFDHHAALAGLPLRSRSHADLVLATSSAAAAQVPPSVDAGGALRRAPSVPSLRPNKSDSNLLRDIEQQVALANTKRS